MTGSTGSGSTGSGSTGSGSTGSGSKGRAGGRWWRLPVVIAAIVLLGGAAIAWLQPEAASTAYLNPGNADPNGGHALAAILAGRSEQVQTAASANIAAAEARGTPGNQVTIFVTNPALLTTAQLAAIGRTRDDVVLVDADPAALAALAPAVTVAGEGPARVLAPGCSWPAATLAGTADLGGTLLSTHAPGAQGCYAETGHPSLIQYTAAGRQITVLGSGAPFTNENLGNAGNAALALNLLGGEPRLIWLTPAASAAAPPAAAGQVSFFRLIPRPVYMVAIQLIIAVVLLALWRVRRLGPLVPERLPVVVRASETAEGHGRLYQARHARDRAAKALRDAAIGRMLPALGLAPDAGPAALAAAMASRTGEPAADVSAVLTDPGLTDPGLTDPGLTDPGLTDDAALVALADRLDELERRLEVR
jgi:hypothetical protein